MLKSIDARHAHEANRSGVAKPKMLDAMKRKLVADYEAQMSHGVKFKALKMKMRHANSIINTAYKGQKTVETQFLQENSQGSMDQNSIDSLNMLDIKNQLKLKEFNFPAAKYA